MRDTFGTWLKQRRIGLGLTQKELAQKLGCSAALIRKMEADERRPSRQVAQLLVTALEIDEANQPTFLKFARSRASETASTALASALVSPLTSREDAVLRLILQDVSDADIAQRLSLKIGTVRWYVKQIYGKLGVHSRDEAMLVAEQVLEQHIAKETPSEGERHNLPASTTPLVGRKQEIEQVRSWLLQPSVRLLTLVGPAGIGKTRLSLEVAADAGFTSIEGQRLVQWPFIGWIGNADTAGTGLKPAPAADL